MSLLRPAFIVFMLLLSACVQAREILVTVAYNNLSDSYVYPYRVSFNGKHGAHAALVECSNGTGAGALITTALRQPPRFIVVEWEHLVTRKVYRARVELSDAAGPWWRKTPFRDADGNPESRRPTLVIQWRGPKKVAAMLVADNMDFARASLDLGEAEGKEIPRPDWGPELYLGYSQFRRKPWTTYQPGSVSQYRRSDDDTLPPEQRFGCPRLPNGRLDTRRLPPQKLPYLVGADGEHIPCREYFCADKADLIRKLRRLGWLQYPPDSTPPAPEFGDAPNPQPAR